MKILAVEFSSSQRSVAVFNPEAGSITESVDTRRGHSMKPFMLIDSALKRAGIEREQIEGIAVGLGPGSYTGIRAAIAIANGWKLARNVLLCGIGSADSMAKQESAENSTGRFNIVIDAQRDEFYLATYNTVARQAKLVSPLSIMSLESVRERERAGEIIIGPEATRWFSSARLVFPRAATLAQRATTTEFVSDKKLEPVYLRETKFVKALPARIESA